MNRLRTALAALSLAACSSSPRTVLMVQPGTELVCTARAPHDTDTVAPVAIAPPPDASVPLAVVDAGVPPPDASAPITTVQTTAADAGSPPVPAVSDPARLALLRPERTWTVARLARCEGARAVLLLRDGTVISHPAASLRALRLRAGAEVMALWGDPPGEPYHAVVLDTTGTAVRVRYDDGTEESTELSRIESVVRAEPAAVAVSCPPPPGAMPSVFVARESWRRVAVMVECGGPSALVDTVRDGRTTVPLASLSRAALSQGDRVMVRWRDGADYAARVDRVNGASLDITYDDGGTEETINAGQVVSLAARDGAPAAQPYRCP